MNRRSMLLGCGLLMLTLLLPFQAAAAEAGSEAVAQEDIQVTIKELKTDQAATKVRITSAVNSVYELESVRATTSDREVPLARACPSCDWTGEMPLSGLTKGTQNVVVTAVDIYGGKGVGTGTFIYDEPPVVTRLEPANNHAVIRNNSLHVIAEAEDDLAQPSFLVQIGEDLRYPDIIESDQGAGKFDRVYDVAKYDGSSLNIQYFISDGSRPDGDDNRRVVVNRTVHLESSPELVEMERETDAQILDADASRLLLIRNGTLIIKDRHEGTETELLKGITTDRSNGFKLTPAGAAFLIDTGWYEMKLFWWNGEELAYIPVEAGSSWQLKGNYAASSDFGTLHWIDTLTGTTRNIPYADDLNFELEPGGTLLLEPYSSGQQSDQILRYDPLTGSATAALAYAGAPRGPVTDGEVILFTIEDGSLMKYQNGTVTEVVHGTTAERLRPHEGYEVSEGWIAFQKRNSSDIPQLYVQSPDGTAMQATHFNTGATIRSLDRSGNLVLANAGKLYQYAQETDKSTLIAGGAGIVRWIDGQLHYLLGDTVFTVKSQTPTDPLPKPETLLNRFDGTILDFDQNQIVWKQAGDKVLWLYNRIDKSQVKVYDGAGSEGTIVKAMLSDDGIVYTQERNGQLTTYFWKNGSVINHWAGQKGYETRDLPDGMVVYTSNGSTYLYDKQGGKLLYSFSGPGKLEYREHGFSGPGGKQYRFDAWYRVDGGSLYGIRI